MDAELRRLLRRVQADPYDYDAAIRSGNLARSRGATVVVKFGDALYWRCSCCSREDAKLVWKDALMPTLCGMCETPGMGWSKTRTENNDRVWRAKRYTSRVLGRNPNSMSAAELIALANRLGEKELSGAKA